METLEAIKTRRSIRRYKPDPVDEATLAQVLEAARWAPSWSNTQCWRFIVVKDAAIKNALADALIASDPERGNPANKALRAAPVVIVICAELGRSGFKSGNAATDKGDWFMFDCGIAAENLVLAAHALGLGTVHVGLFDAKKVGQLLGVPEGFCVVELTPLGYPDGESRGPARKELSEIAFSDKFGAKFKA